MTALGWVIAATSGADGGGLFDRFVEWAVALMEQLGGFGAGIAIFLENLFPPLPSELILPLAGFTASRGELSLASAITWTTIGSVGGATVLYEAGRLLGVERIRRIAGALPLVNVTDVDRTVAWFGRHGRKAVFFGRMVPIFRSLVSVPAGMDRMPWPTFLLFTTLGSLLWNSLFIVGGFLLGENYDRLASASDLFGTVVIVGAAVAVLWFVGTRAVGRRRRPDRDEPTRPRDDPGDAT